MKKIKCVVCNGSGKVPTVPIYTMDNLQLAEEIHKIALSRWEEDNPKDSIICLAFELKARLKKGVERAEQT